MKKLMFTLCAVLLLTLTMSVGAFAAEIPTAEPSNVTITVVLPGKPEAAAPGTDTDTPPEAEIPQESDTDSETETDPAPAVPEIIVLYPVDVTESHLNGGWQIVKTYELTALDNPNNIPRGDFERRGANGAEWSFALTDIIKRETANAETMPHKETVTLNTDTKELEKILPLLAPTMEYKTEDEFVGILTLDVASIKVETAGTKTSSYTMTQRKGYAAAGKADCRPWRKYFCHRS